MKERDISQAELGRRVGISQASIYNLVSGKGYGSRHLHLIARELGTTPAYLTGETDDPESDVPDSPTLSRDDLSLVEQIHRLSPPDRAAIVQIVATMAACADGQSKNGKESR